MDSLTVIIIVFVVYTVVCALFCGRVAEAKDYSYGAWFFAGLFFGVFALIAIAGMPDRLVSIYLKDVAHSLNTNLSDLKKILTDKAA